MLEKSKEALEVFYDLYVRAVVTTKRYNNRLMYSDLAPNMMLSTISDDAYALLTLENNEDVWLERWENEGGDEGNEEKDNQDDNTATASETKYTETYKGWNNDGKRRYNALYDMFREFRERCPNFFMDICRAVRAEKEKEGNLLKQKSKDDDESVGSIRNDSFLAMGMDTQPLQSTAAASPQVEEDSEIGAHIEEGEMEQV